MLPRIKHVRALAASRGSADYPDQAGEPYFETITMFGTERCLIASDFPADKLSDIFDRHLDAHDVAA